MRKVISEKTNEKYYLHLGWFTFFPLTSSYCDVIVTLSQSASCLSTWAIVLFTLACCKKKKKKKSWLVTYFSMEKSGLKILWKVNEENINCYEHFTRNWFSIFGFGSFYLSKFPICSLITMYITCLLISRILQGYFKKITPSEGKLHHTGWGVVLFISFPSTLSFLNQWRCTW